MADISAFPTIRNVLDSGNNIINLEANATIKAGMVVAGAATGISGEVGAALPSTGHAIGVALYDAVDGDQIAVAGPGCVVTVANADDTTGIDAWHYVEVNDNAVGGTVSVVDEAVAAHDAVLTIIGLTIDDIAGGGTGRIMIISVPHITAAS